MSCLVAIDCDGTVEISGGPVTLMQLRNWQVLGHRVLVIGNVVLQHYGFEGVRDQAGPRSGLEYGKSRALREWSTAFPGHDRYLVVDDNPAQYAEGIPAPWELLSPSAFMGILPP